MNNDSEIKSFTTLCLEGNYDAIENFLADSNNHDDISLQYEYAFAISCYSGDVNFIKYLLSPPKYHLFNDINITLNAALKEASEGGNLEVVKYLLTTPELKDKVDLHYSSDAIFKAACKENKLEVLKYLIFDLNIEKTSCINQYLSENPNQEIENLFKIRTISQELTTDLPINGIIPKKNKL